LPHEELERWRFDNALQQVLITFNPFVLSILTSSLPFQIFVRIFLKTLFLREAINKKFFCSILSNFVFTVRAAAATCLM
jgi:hypothetical protein